MLFNSFEFLGLFCPLVILLFFMSCKYGEIKTSKIILLLASICFYIINSKSMVLYMALSILVNFMLYKYIRINRYPKACLIIGLVYNLASLFLFKYTDFIIENLSLLFNTQFNVLSIIMPLGISFLVFQQISFIVDVYREPEKFDYSLINYANYILYFPKIIQGPITYHYELIPQLEKHETYKVNYSNLSKGLYSFIIGLAKKVLLADVIGNIVNSGYANINELSSLDSVILIIGFSLQIYFDFSGYCNMAEGVSLCFNINLPQNFKSPYKVLNISEFWKRWHITLTRFFTKYVYIPLGGNRKGIVVMGINTMIVFLLSGLWHGASWTFVFWGALHGIALLIYKMLHTYFDKLPNLFSWLITFSFVSICWVYFRAETFADANNVITNLFNFDFDYKNSILLQEFETVELKFIYSLFDLNIISQYLPIVSTILYFFISFLIITRRNVEENINEFRPTMKKAFILIFLFVWSIISLSNVTTFIYAGF